MNSRPALRARTHCSPPSSPTSSFPSCNARAADPDLYASSVSSADLSPPPPPTAMHAHSTQQRAPQRPDSPRPFLADATAVAAARLQQLSVWSDAAEDERDLHTSDIDDTPPSSQAPPSSPPHTSPLDVSALQKAPMMPPVGDLASSPSASSSGGSRSNSPVRGASRRQPDRVRGSMFNIGQAHAPLSRRKSFFSPPPTEGIVRRPSLWNGRPKMMQGDGDCDNDHQRSAARAGSVYQGVGGYARGSFYSVYGMPRSRSSRRPQSFHRYARIVPDVYEKGTGGRSSYAKRAVDLVGDDDDFDDLVDGLQATKVTETHLQPPA